MKAALFALSAGTLLGSATALHPRHAAFHEKRFDPPPALDYGCCKTVVTVTVYPSSTAAPVVPTPILTVVPTPGVYVLPETQSTVTWAEDTTVVQPTTIMVTPGPNTWGGVVTSVAAATTVTCPYGDWETNEGTVNSVLKTTTYVCPSAGEWTVVPQQTTTASVSTVIVYPVPESYAAGTYTIPVSTVTAVFTSQVFVCPYETVAPAAPTPAVGWPAPAPQAPAPAPPAAWPSPAAPAAPSPPSGGISTNGNKWAMTYTPYTTTGACKAAGDVMTDIAAIAAKGFTAIRLYGTDCSGLQNVGSAAIASNIKLILGIFIEASGIEAARPQIAEITGWGSQGGNWGHVIMLVVGNEAIQDGYCQAGALASFISDAKSAMAAAGGGGIPVTTTEPLDALIASAGALCPVIDVVAANIQSYFNGGIDASQAGSFVASQLEIVAQQCPGKTAYNLESGWPSAGNANGASVASPDAQKAAMADIADKAGDKTVMFSFSDDGWKTPGPLDVEQHFGCLDLF